MKKLLLASAAVAGITGSAFAADVMVYEPAPVAPSHFASPTYDWSGHYVGVLGSYGSGKSRQTDTSGTTTGDYDINGWGFGATAGHNWQTGSFVFGLEGDISWTGISGAEDLLGDGSFVYTTDVNWLGTVRGRLGWAADRFLFYGTGGLAFGGVDSTAFLTPTTYVSRDTRVGWAAGLGVEFALHGNWTAKVEYLHVDLGDKASIPTPITIDSVPVRIDMLRVGANYRW